MTRRIFRASRCLLFGLSLSVSSLLTTTTTWSQPVMPLDYGQQVNGFQENFEGLVRNPLWVPRSAPSIAVQDVYVQTNGVLKVGKAFGPESNHLAYEAPGYSDTVQEVLVRMRITKFDSTVEGDGRCGVATVIDPNGTGGVNVFFSRHPVSGRPGVRHLDIRDDGRRWGGTYLFDWELNSWYWLRMRHEPNEDPGVHDILVKVWPADGVTPEPGEWIFTSDNYPTRTIRTGFAGIVAGLKGHDSEFEVDYFLLKAEGLPTITVAPPTSAPPQITALTPAHESLFVNPQSEVSFTVVSSGTDTDKIRLILNGQDRSSQLQFGGTAVAREVRLKGGLQANTIYTGRIEVTDQGGKKSDLDFTFNTFYDGIVFIEFEDFNYDGGKFIDNPVPTSEWVGPTETNYFERPGINGIDYNETNFASQTFYRNDPAVGISRSTDFFRQHYQAVIDAGAEAVYDYNLGFLEVGEWHNYTRTFPAGRYHVYARMAQAAVPFAARLDLVTSDRTKPDQQTQALGRFRQTFNTGGTQVYALVPLTDENGKLVEVELSGVQTLRTTVVEGTATGSGANATAYNANYMVFVPVRAQDAELVIAGVRREGSSIVLQWSGSAPPYAVQRKQNLSDSEWVNVTTTSQTSTTIPAAGASGFFRISGRVSAQ